MDSVSIAFISFIVGGLIGGLIGHWLAIGRDKRREYNEVIDPIFEKLIAERDNTSPYSEGMSNRDFHVLIRHLGWFKRRSLRIHYESYKNAKDKNHIHDESGQASYINPATVKSTVDNLIKFMNRK